MWREGSVMNPEKRKVLDGTTLKIIAMTSMVCDHIGDNFFPAQTWLRIIGRMALPLFAFCLAEGWTHTRSKKNYLARLCLFALISEIPFDLVTSGKVLEFSHQNVIMTFSWSLLTLYLAEKAGLRGMLKYTVLALSAVLSLVFGMDYGLLAPGIIFIYCLLNEKSLYVRNLWAMAYHVLLRNMGIWWFGLLGFVPVFFYSGKKGKGLKWLFYVFYPGHLFLIWLLREFVLHV